MILVTGGTGLVGSHLLYQLALQNEDIIALHRKSSDLSSVKKVFSYYSDNFETPVKIQGTFNKYEASQTCRAFYGLTKNDILISFDNKVYKLLNGKTVLWSEFVGTIPSVFFNGNLIK